MPHVSGFKHDIFVSYASVDNEPDGQNVRWVSRFRKDIEIALRQRLGQEIKIFFDAADLLAHHQLEQLIVDAKNSAIFLALLSPSYVQREWPLAELKAFGAAAQSTQNARRPNCIVTIEILPVDEVQLPTEIQRLKRTRFYEIDQDSRVEFKLTPESNSKAYNERVHQLAHQLVLLLRELRERHASEDSTVASSAPAGSSQNQSPAPGRDSGFTPASRPAGIGRTVLLAQVTDDLYNARQQVLSYLEDLGVTVMPEGEYPANGAKFAAAVRADIERADLFIQLLSDLRSFKPEDLRAGETEQAKSYAQFQYDAALRRRVPILQWRRPDIKLDEIPPFNWDRQLLEGFDVRVMGLQEFQKEIRAAIDRLNQPPPPPKNGFSFINADGSDQDSADELVEKAFKALSEEAWRSICSGSAREIEKDLEDNLVGCRSLLLIYGKASAAWVRAQLRRWSKLAPQRQTPLRPKVLLYPPLPKDDIGGTGDFDVIDCLDGAAVARVQAMIKEKRL